MNARPGCPVCGNVNPEHCYLCRGTYQLIKQEKTRPR